MSVEYKIRKAFLKDTDAIAFTQRMAFADTISHYFGDDSADTRRVKSIIKQIFLMIVRALKNEIFVAEIDGKVVGNIIIPYDMHKTGKILPIYRAFWITILKGLYNVARTPGENRRVMMSDTRFLRELEKTETRRTVKTRVMNVAVLPEYQGLGIGYALMKAGLRYVFNERGANAVTLNVLSTNESAVSLYKKFHFEERERIVNSMGEWIVMVLTRENWLKSKH